MPVYSPALRGSSFAPWGLNFQSPIDAVYEQMYGPMARAREPDPVIKLMLGDPDIAFGRYVWRSRFSAVEWRVVGGAPEQRAFVWAALKDFLDQWIETALWSLDFGRQAVELSWTREDVTVEWAEGDAEEAKPRKRVMRGAYVPRSPRALDPEQTAILVDDRGDYAGLRYFGASAPIPAERTVLFVNEDLWGDLLGVQFTARAKPDWEDFNFGRLWLNRYLESKGDPPLVGTAPGLEETDEDGNIANPIRVMATAAKNLRGGGSIVLPFEVDPDSKLPAYTLKALEVAQRAEEFLPWLGDCRAGKRLAWCIPGGVASAPGQGGSFAKASVDFGMIDPFFDVVKKAVLLRGLNQHLIPKMVEANYGQTPRSERPQLEGGDLSSNVKAYSLELLKNGYAGTTILPSGKRVRVSHLADLPKVLKTLNVPTVDEALIPEAPEEIDLGAGGAGDGGGLRPGPGQPKRIIPEDGRAAAPSRPGLSRAFALPAPDAWLSGTLSGLAAIDDVVFAAERLAEAERRSVEAEIRNLAVKAIARARTEDGAVLASNRTLARDLERDVRGVLEESLHQDLLDVQEIDADALGFAGRKRSPLAAAHGMAYRAAAETLGAAGVSAPGKPAAIRIVRDVVRDAARNGSGVVVRETRRIVENVDRLVIGETPTKTAEAVVEGYELPERDFVASTVHHVRATARATLSWPGAQADAEAFVVMAGPASEATLLDRYPSGQVAEQLWTVWTAQELDQGYRELVVEQGRPVTSWRNLGLNFGSPEMYVPIPLGLLGAVAAVVAERRREWNRKRLERQAEIEALRRGETPGNAMSRAFDVRATADADAEGEDVTKEELRTELALFRAGIIGEVTKMARAFSPAPMSPPAPPPPPPAATSALQLHFPGASVVMPAGTAVHMAAANVSVDGVAAAAAQVAGAIADLGAAGAQVAQAIAAKELPAPSVTVTPEITAKVELELPAPRKRTVVLDGPDGKTTMEIQ